MARARGLASGHARGHRRAAPGGRLLPRRSGRGLPVARVRRRPPDSAMIDAAGASEAPPVRAPLDTLPTTRRAILNLLKRRGPLADHAVAGELGLTPSAIRLQLIHLEEDGLLERTEALSSTGRGRPAHLYALTPAAEALYFFFNDTPTTE